MCYNNRIMDEKELKTSIKQRIVIAVIAVLLLGSTIAGYAMIIVSGNKAGLDGDGTGISQEKIFEYERAYDQEKVKFAEFTKDDFDRFIKYKSEIKAYNEISANSNGVQTRDIELGSGRELTAEDNDYLAYYVGWCADGSIFDSSFDSKDDPTSFNRILDASLGMIEGWNLGIEGMKLGGIREVTIASELAYKDQKEICGGYNKPLKFMIMTKANEGSLATSAKELEEAYMRLQYAYYGIDYDAK